MEGGGVDGALAARDVVFLIIMGQFCHDIKLSAKTGSQISYLMVLGI